MNNGLTQSNYQKKYNLCQLLKKANIQYSTYSGSICYTTNKHRVYVKFIEGNSIQIDTENKQYVPLKIAIKKNILPERKTLKLPDIHSLIVYLYHGSLLEEDQIDCIIKALSERVSYYDIFGLVMKQKMKNNFKQLHNGRPSIKK